jgi:hypothetical protein
MLVFNRFVKGANYFVIGIFIQFLAFVDLSYGTFSKKIEKKKYSRYKLKNKLYSFRNWL